MMIDTNAVMPALAQSGHVRRTSLCLLWATAGIRDRLAGTGRTACLRCKKASRAWEAKGSLSMLTRRDALAGAATAGVVLRTRTSFSKASQPETPVNFDVPENACDFHTYIHADPQQFPFFSGRIYTPELASPEEMSALL